MSPVRASGAKADENDNSDRPESSSSSTLTGGSSRQGCGELSENQKAAAQFPVAPCTPRSSPRSCCESHGGRPAGASVEDVVMGATEVAVRFMMVVVAPTPEAHAALVECPLQPTARSSNPPSRRPTPFTTPVTLIGRPGRAKRSLVRLEEQECDFSRIVFWSSGGAARTRTMAARLGGTSSAVTGPDLATHDRTASGISGLRPEPNRGWLPRSIRSRP